VVDPVRLARHETEARSVEEPGGESINWPPD